MTPTQHTKQMLKDAFPSMWLHWHFMRRPRSAERELLYLDKVVPPGAVTVDVGANCGLYTRRLARLSEQVHAFEPSHTMAALLRRTSASNVSIHEIALSDREGDAELYIPQGEAGPVHGRASLEAQDEFAHRPVTAASVPLARLDDVVHDRVAFVKVDVEGHELSVLNGAVQLVARCQPVFLVEAEDRHRAGATRSVFDYFRDRSYRGFYLHDDSVVPVEHFDSAALQDERALLPNGGRRPGQSYVNNFFFFPQHMDGDRMLNG